MVHQSLSRAFATPGFDLEKSPLVNPEQQIKGAQHLGGLCPSNTHATYFLLFSTCTLKAFYVYKPVRFARKILLI